MCPGRAGEHSHPAPDNGLGAGQVIGLGPKISLVPIITPSGTPAPAPPVSDAYILGVARLQVLCQVLRPAAHQTVKRRLLRPPKPPSGSRGSKAKG
jgi:hypothetical protein